MYTGTVSSMIVDNIRKKGLELINIEKVSHPEVRNWSFKAAVRLEDKEKALKSEIWPCSVRVCQYRTFRNRENQGEKQPQFE